MESTAGTPPGCIVVSELTVSRTSGTPSEEDKLSTEARKRWSQLRAAGKKHGKWSRLPEQGLPASTLPDLPKN